MNENTDGSGVGGFGIGGSGVISWGGGNGGVVATVSAGSVPTGCAAGQCPSQFSTNLPLIIVGVVVLVLILR
jgi:hypothetical protein